MPYNGTILVEFPDVLDAKMISKILRIGYTKALSTIQYGGMDHVKIGNTYRVTKSSFLRWLEEGGKKEVHHVD